MFSVPCRNFVQLSTLLPAVVLVIVLRGCELWAVRSFLRSRDHIGATRCITGKVIRVQRGNGGVHFVDFCEDFLVCPFTVVVFPGDLKRVGDIRRLAGRQIGIEGEVKGYDGAPRSCSSESANCAATPRKFLPRPRNTTSSAMGTTAPASFIRPRRSSNQPTRGRRRQSSIQDLSQPMSPTDELSHLHTSPLRNSSRGYFVPRQVTPSFHSVRTIERSKV